MMKPGDYFIANYTTKEVNLFKTALKLNVETRQALDFFYGRKKIDEIFAKKLEMFTGKSASEWLAIQKKYDDWSNIK